MVLRSSDEKQTIQRNPDTAPWCQSWRKGYAGNGAGSTGKKRRNQGYNVPWRNGGGFVWAGYTIWIPDCTKAAQYYYPLSYDEKVKRDRQLRNEDADPDSSRIVEGTESGEDRLTEEQLAGMPWYLATVIAGENRIENNLEHPMSAGNRSDGYVEDCGPSRYSWSCGARFQNPEDIVLQKEEKAERCAALSEKQREVYQLYYVDSFTQEEIAETLGISQQAVNYRLESVRKKIAEYYERNL